MGATYPPINITGTGQKNCTGRDKSSPLLPTNGEAQTNQLSTNLDVYDFDKLPSFTLSNDSIF